MNINPVDELLKTLADQDNGQQILHALVCWLRPRAEETVHDVTGKVDQLSSALEEQPELLEILRRNLCTFMTGLRFLPLYSETGILPRRGFAAELSRRIYGLVLPEPSLVYSARDLVAQLFDQEGDGVWTGAVSEQTWLRLLRVLVPGDSTCEIRRHLQSEALYALEMLSIWLAAEEMEGELLRLDPTIAGRDSSLIAQAREISLFVQFARVALDSPVPFPHFDIRHAWVLLDQTRAQVLRFRQKSVTLGSSFRLTYLLERIEQTLQRVRDLLFILSSSDQDDVSIASVRLFLSLVAAQRAERSVGHLLRQTRHLVAKSIVGHAGRTGEHYVTETRAEYLDMIRSGLGAGVIIAVMALIKIGIVGLGLTPGWKTVWVCLNYGLGFMLIHLLHFTVATKQPAMTASYIAKAIEDAGHGQADLQTVARLCVQVLRSQFAAVLGNVGAALPAAVVLAAVGSLVAGAPFLPDVKAQAMMHELTPFSGLGLLHAAIAGVWLCTAGLVAGYFDNRSAYLGLPERLRRHPWRPRAVSDAAMDRFAEYLGANYGALVGNFFFGVMLGLTAYAGYLTGLPLDIRHVAFSVANLGYAACADFPGVWMFLQLAVFTGMIGLVNLAVSFVLALDLGMRARGVSIRSIPDLVAALWKAVRTAPRDLFLPPSGSDQR